MKKRFEGVVKLSYEAYEKAPGLRQSDLTWMERSPAHYRAAVLAPPKEDTKAGIMGTLFHTAILEPDLFKKAYHVKPKTYENAKKELKKWNANANECKEWLAKHSNRPVISGDEQSALLAMRGSVMAHSSARAALVGGMTEHCMFVNDPHTGIKMKARPDRLTGNAIVDPKSTDDASPSGFARSIFKFNYHIQAAWYLDIANLLGLEKKHFIFIAVEKEPPYAVEVYELDQESIAIGRSKYRKWIELFATCSERDEWPGYNYDQVITEISLPYWAKKLSSESLLTL